ncbi:MAG TPA: efflux RND transporter periplasmic adaptor subunit [Ktedonobacterales bacterium]
MKIDDSVGSPTQNDAFRTDVDAPRDALPQTTPDYGQAAPATRPAQKRVRSRASWIRSHRKLVGAVGAGALLVAVLIAWAAARLQSPPVVTVYTVHTQTLTTYVAGGGLTYPFQQMNIVYPVSAAVINVNVQVGQPVKARQVLLTLNNADLQAQLQRAQAQVSAARNYLNGVLNTPTSTPAIIAQAQSNLDQAEGVYSSLSTELNSPEFSNGNILSPFVGVVTAVNATPGTVTSAGAVLVSVANMSSIIVKVEFPIDQRALISLNQAVDVYPSAVPDQHFTGTISTINPQLTSPGSDTFEAWVTVNNSSGALFSGESVYARVQTHVTFPTVPELSVVNPDADSVVFLYSNGHVHLRHVVVGSRDGDKFGIANGLQEGDEVVLVGQYQLSDNEAVTVRSIQP